MCLTNLLGTYLPVYSIPSTGSGMAASPGDPPSKPTFFFILTLLKKRLTFRLQLHCQGHPCHQLDPVGMHTASPAVVPEWLLIPEI